MLAFRADPDGLNPETLAHTDGTLRIRTMARVLEGMQKEALVQYGPSGTLWRLICDEGPWLNGSDLAPFPLAFFTAGSAATLMSEFLAEARDRELRVDSLHLTQDNFFTMQGSALQGTMAAGVQPAKVILAVRGDGSAAQFEEIATSALHGRSPAECCMRSALSSLFAVRANNEALDWPGEPAGAVASVPDPAGLFAALRPLSNGGPTLIEKTAGVAAAQGPAVGLSAEQKRVVHVHTEGTVRDDGLKSLLVRCVQPQGSCFRLLSDDSRIAGGLERAPSGLAYLSAGIAFCFMTQIGRYAQISKQRLHGYCVVQDTAFRLAADRGPDASAVETLLWLDTDEPRDRCIQLVRMAEQTCYVHAAFRTPAATTLKFS